MSNAAIPQANDDKLTLAEPRDSMLVVREPVAILTEAIKAAEALKRVIDNKPHKVVLGGETYLENEDWLTVARFYGVTVRIRSTKFIEYGDGETYHVRGFEAVAEAYLVERNTVISTAESMCLSDEPNWNRKPLFQLRSMAQTRASSRVLRQVLGWVVVLAGYKPTPAEEMQDVGGSRQAMERCSDCGEDVEPGQAVAMRKLYRKPLCRICEKEARRRAGDKVMEPIADPQFVRKSVQEIRQKAQQQGRAVVAHLDAIPIDQPMD